MIQLKTHPSPFFSPVLGLVSFPQCPALYRPKGRTGNREKEMSVWWLWSCLHKRNELFDCLLMLVHSTLRSLFLWKVVDFPKRWMSGSCQSVGLVGDTGQSDCHDLY